MRHPRLSTCCCSVLVVLGACGDAGDPTSQSTTTALLDRELPAEIDVLGVVDAWRVSTGDGSVVAVLDTGIDGEHPALSGHVAEGFDATVDGGGPADSDPRGHGTGVGGALLQVAPDATVVPVRVALDRTTPAQAVARGLAWAVDHPDVDVILLPYSTERWDDAVVAEIARATSDGIPVLVPAGNRGTSSEVSVAGLEGVVTVGAVDRAGSLQHYSGHATRDGVVAPGGDADPAGLRVTVPRPGGGSTTIAGTSLSVALAAGVVALARSANRSASLTDVVRCLRESSEDLGDVGPDEIFGHGMVHARRAVDCVGGG